jgi:hypothetical protein
MMMSAATDFMFILVDRVSRKKTGARLRGRRVMLQVQFLTEALLLPPAQQAHTDRAEAQQSQ